MFRGLLLVLGVKISAIQHLIQHLIWADKRCIIVGNVPGLLCDVLGVLRNVLGVLHNVLGMLLNDLGVLRNVLSIYILFDRLIWKWTRQRWPLVQIYLLN